MKTAFIALFIIVVSIFSNHGKPSAKVYLVSEIQKSSLPEYDKKVIKNMAGHGFKYCIVAQGTVDLEKYRAEHPDEKIDTKVIEPHDNTSRTYCVSQHGELDTDFFDE